MPPREHLPLLCGKRVGRLGPWVLKGLQLNVSWEEKAGKGPGFQRHCWDLGSGLEELLVHLGAEGSTGGQHLAHKLLGHMPGEGATYLQVLGPQGQSIYGEGS